jgi:hypothetical protein
MKVLARVQDVGAAHFRVMARGFEQLQRYVPTQRVTGHPG